MHVFHRAGIWLAGVAVSPGTLALAGHFTVGLGFLTVAVMAILCAIIRIADKLDMG